MPGKYGHGLRASSGALPMRKQRHREVKPFPQGHPAEERQSLCLTPKPRGLPLRRQDLVPYLTPALFLNAAAVCGQRWKSLMPPAEIQAHRHPNGNRGCGHAPWPLAPLPGPAASPLPPSFQCHGGPSCHHPPQGPRAL